MYKSYFRMTFAISDIIILLYVDGYIKTIVVTIGNLIYAPMRWLFSSKKPQAQQVIFAHFWNFLIRTEF